MLFDLPPHVLDVWEKTLLPTTSSRILPLQSGNEKEILSVLRSSEAGDTEFRVTRLPDGTVGLIELSSSQSGEPWSSLLDTQTSLSETRCPSYISALMDQQQKQEPTSEEIPDESTSVEWLQTRLTSDTSLKRTVLGSLPRTLSSLASAIQKIGNSLHN
nr:MAG TPA_asm: hypothetical protein [Caudoviricetes sp.]